MMIQFVEGRLCAAFLLVALVAGCGGGGGGGGDTAPEAVPAADYYPLHTGDRRAYESAYSDGTKFRYAIAVGAATTVNGQTGFPEQLQAPNAVQSDSQVLVKTESGVRLIVPGADGTFEMIRLPASVGMAYAQHFSASGEDIDQDQVADVETYDIASTVAGLETVETPAGRFERALHMRHQITVNTRRSTDGVVVTGVFTNDYWFAPGVGMVRQGGLSSDGEGGDIVLLAHKIDGRSTDTTAPRLTNVSPGAGQVAPDGTRIRLQFDEPLMEADVAVSAVTVRDSTGIAVPLSSYSPLANEIALTNLDRWQSGTYTVEVGTGLTDLMGNPVAPFTHTVTIDASRTGVSWTTPLDGDPAATLKSGFRAGFSTLLDSASVPGSVVLREGNTVVATTVTHPGGSSNYLEIAPATALKPLTTYTVTFPTLKDSAGNPVVQLAPWTFTTAATVTASAKVTAAVRRPLAMR
ncbi:Ig-like domain-containing protein [Rhizobacter sp. Root1221]|uniref:Ig-like domain-containing protein n=1 Tax=Rhizobacter sp. Root1221 TaxID=1736433 RepID=UPI001F210978|nr:Ig-like domain-containing protein [Rhizobacter sp. Root1221]